MDRCLFNDLSHVIQAQREPPANVGTTYTFENLQRKLCCHSPAAINMAACMTSHCKVIIDSILPTFFSFFFFFFVFSLPSPLATLSHRPISFFSRFFNFTCLLIVNHDCGKISLPFEKKKKQKNLVELPSKYNKK